MSIVLLIIQIISALPGLFRALKEIQDFIKTRRDKNEKAALQGDFALAMHAVKETKDPRPILDLRDRIRKRRKAWLESLRTEANA